MGIDIEKIKKKAIEKHIYTECEINSVDEKELISLIFREEFSTNENVTELSGRGIGLNAVKVELDKIGGTIDINTQKDIGTEFVFKLPL